MEALSRVTIGAYESITLAKTVTSSSDVLQWNRENKERGPKAIFLAGGANRVMAEVKNQTME